MSTRVATSVLLAALFVLVGCGGDDGDGDEDEAIRAAVQRFVDQNDCSAASDRFLEAAYPGESDPLAACERETLEGLRAGEYSIDSVDAEGNTATVNLTLVTEGTRTYTLVKEGSDWLVDDLAEEVGLQSAAIGKPLEYFDSLEINRRPIDVRLTVTTLAIAPADAPEFYPSRGGRWYRARARIKSESSGPFYVSVSDFSLVDSQGQRTQGNSAFEPPLARDSVDLAPGDEITGFVGFEIPKGSKPTEVRYAHPASGGASLSWPLD